MTNRVVDIGGLRVLVFADEGPLLASPRDGSDFLGEAWGAEAAMMAIPVMRLDPDFLRLRTRLAGEVIQGFVNYRMRLAIVGDVSSEVARSDALRDFIVESNRGDTVWFVETMDDLKRRLAD